ncbi:putative alpha-ketoglutarate-dependent sulfonate dioxygenase [Aspergillus heteromorphus CBS 117.55]|uniref:Putative alpha-ketoglutarate-dependent sulfonate dioxygenase n=1 Tax=Aspergillus heteromorphus CBS 117.55 TaxID=1448321 RepID=A0A317VX71_9EURO|nr:putative alpha-ketoglutarate-dependent sulfonate dioxygenase [Aspergillus heteromorphus CBS 117.55]PWY78375.1 putative alpha-ketoglutarate-dependent sulfonate dioxygenase [Aspergillus heteromorphus CBS 117.55]
MAPSLTENSSEIVVPLPTKTLDREPLKSTGALDSYTSFDVTPIIGREFTTGNLKEWLRAPNSDDLLRELALTISQRGVVFFRKQDDLDNELQKELVQRLGQLSGKPATSGLHVHPVINSRREEGARDDEISVISSVQREKLFSGFEKKQSQRREWHSDITFEPIPSDYTILRLTELPKTGGDTLWASGYELYDRISAPYQKFLESLTATYAQPGFNDAARKHNFDIFVGPRGAPENVGEELKATHPVIRTNPVTGWKSVFAVGHHVQKIDGLAEEESRALLDWFVKLIVENHDLQVRFRWQDPNDLAIWDNRSVYHAATLDYAGLGARTGQRAVGLGERPYLDPKSTGRQEALAKAS